jgi:polar amino acid transport system substrate-binding protein
MIAIIGVVFGRSFIYKTTPSDLIQTQILPSEQDSGDAFIVHYHERRPYYFSDDKGVQGLCVDPLKQALDKAGIPFKWAHTPSKRQLEIIKQNKGRDCVLGWFKTPEREVFAKYSRAIYQDLPAIALARADNPNIHSPMRVEDVLSNNNLVLLKKDGYSYGAFLDNQIASLVPRHKITSANNNKMLEMIRIGRADYFFIAKEEADILIGALDIPKDTFQYIHFSNMPSGNKRYVLFSHQVEDALIEKINSVMASLQVDQTEKIW